MSTRDEVVASLTRTGSTFELEPTPMGGPGFRYVGPPHTLREVFEATSAFGDRECLVFGDERYTFTAQYRYVTRIAAWLEERGIERGDRVAIASRNYPEFAFTFWAIQVLGAIAVPFNAWWSDDELRHALADAAPKAVFADGERARRVRDTRCSESTLLIEWRPAADGSCPGAIPWREVLANSNSGDVLPSALIDPDDPSTILYTSGTTGTAKGAVLTHRNHCTTILNGAFLGALAAASAGTVAPSAHSTRAISLHVLPWFHIGGLSGLCAAAFSGTTIVATYRFDVDNVLDLIERERITTFGAVPSSLRQVLASPRLANHDLSSLVAITTGAAPVPRPLIEAITTTFEGRVNVSMGYGLTETTASAVVSMGDECRERPECAGHPLPVVKIRIIDEDGRDLPPGRTGEILIGGATVARGYWNRPDETAAAFQCGWFHTGDLGRLDDEGRVNVSDRLKDVIIRGGEKIYSPEVEAVLLDHPDVEEAALIGLANEDFGEIAVAVVVTRPGRPLPQQALYELCKASLAYYKVPSRFVQMDVLPRNAVGKLLKHELRQRVGRDQESM